MNALFPAFPRLRRLRRSLGWMLLACGAVLTAAAFPPNPHYTIFGLVRDQVGNTLRVEGAVLVLLNNNVEIGRTPVQSEPTRDLNYELNIRIDQTRSSTRVYTNKAVAANGVYSLYVELSGEKFYPIEVAGTLRAGNGGERVRLDLTLGADKNNDGLPDAWQEWVLYQAGRTPGTPGWDINLITKNGDFDGDGTSNFQEYLAGTFAGDATERFELKLVGKSATDVTVEFFAITGKVYTIEESADLKTWTTASFATVQGGTAAKFFRAPAVGVTRGFVTTPPGASRFYRLTAR